MKHFLPLLLLLSICFSIQAQTKLIKADAYLDVRTGELIEPANILIEDGFIKSINPKTIPDDVEVMKLPGKILLPGLMDMHVHLDLDYEGNFDYIYKESASLGAIRAVRNAEKTLLAGFTTVRNLGQLHISKELVVVAVAEASDKAWIKAPRIIPAGHMITIQGGHGDISSGLAEGLVHLDPEQGVINGKYDAIEAVRYQIKNGAKVIKIHATSGVNSPEATVGAQQLSEEEMLAIVEEAARHEIKVAAHAHGTKGIIAAIKAGVYSIEHGSLIDDEGIQLMKEKGVYLVPTLGLNEKMKPYESKRDPKVLVKANYIKPLAKKNIEKAIKEGVNVALGSDAPLIPHGENAYELTAMMEHGMTALEAIKAATINPAKMLHLKDRGEIKEGLLADVIAVDANPLDNIKTLETVKFVMKGGIVYKQEK
jgi:imidazolonepropionase-like amidohydrolase